MAFPSYVLTRTVSVGGAAVLESSDPLRIRLTITASKSLIHAESGYRFKNLSFQTTSEAGTDAVAVLPRTDLPGWKDARTGDVIDVTAEGSYTHQYMALVEYLDVDGNSKGIAPDTIGPFVVPAGDGPIDLDKLVPVGSSSGESISFPAYWDDLVQQAQASAAAAQAALLDSADFIGSEIARAGSPAEQALLPKIGSVAGLTGVSDFVNSWWCAPRSLYSPLRDRIYQGGVDAQGTIEVAQIDRRRAESSTVPLGTFEVDDHNVSAFLVEEDQPPLVAYARHAVESFVRIRVGTVRHDLRTLGAEQQVAFPGATTYVHLLRRPDTQTVALLTRNATGWFFRVSRDWGTTWEAVQQLHGKAYATFNVFNGIATVAATTHPITTPNNDIRVFRISVATGVIYNEAGTILDNLWNFSGAPIPAGSMSYARQSYDTDAGYNSNRVFDLMPDGSVIAMKLNKATPELGGMYGVYRRAVTGATPSSSQSPDDPARGWTFEPIVASGVPVGYYQSSYVGGMTAGANNDEVYLCRESSGTWSFERWTRSGGTWSLAETIYSRSDGVKLGRPQVPWGAYGTGLLLCVEYFRYPEANFGGYYGDQRVFTTGVTSPRPPQDGTPPGAPGGLTSTGGTSSATLTWTAATGSPIAYDIYLAGSRVATVVGLTWTAIALNPGQSYTYSIRAVDAAGNQSNAIAFPAVTPTNPPTQDPILSSGSLLLVDPTNQFGAWAAGVPTSSVPNHVAGGATVAVVNTLTATDGIVERTAKGGLHGIVSHATGAANRALRFDSATLAAYLAANPTHAYYVSAWVAVTRHSIEATPTPPSRMFGFLRNGGVSDVSAARPVTGNKVSVAPSTARTLVVESATPATLNAPVRLAGAHSSLTVTGGVVDAILRMGHASAANLNPSWVFYRGYVEDLTVSGRTAAEVDAIDQALYNGAFGSGGRYAADTFTDPSTLP